MNPGAISAGALRHMQQLKQINSKPPSDKKQPNENNAKRPKMMTAIIILLFIGIVFGVLSMINNEEAMLFCGIEISEDFAVTYNLAVMGTLIYCFFGFIYLQKKALKAFFWIAGITTILRIFGKYIDYTLAKEELAKTLLDQINTGEASGLEFVLETNMNEILTGEFINLAITIPILVYVCVKREDFA